MVTAVIAALQVTVVQIVVAQSLYLGFGSVCFILAADIGTAVVIGGTAIVGAVDGAIVDSDFTGGVKIGALRSQSLGEDMMRTTNMFLKRTTIIMLMLAPAAACAKPATPASTSVTLQQFVQRHEQKLLAGDTDGDAKVSRAEFIAAAKIGKGDPAKRFAKLDQNGDGMLDKSEIDAMLARRFKRLDTNGDGVASANERAAAHARKSGAADSGSDS